MARLSLTLPVVQAPMAGVSTPALAAAVSNAGGLGSLGLGAMDAAGAAAVIAQTRALTNRPFGVNLFCHAPHRHDPAREAAWLERLAPHFRALGAEPPKALRSLYTSLLLDTDMQDVLRQTRPAAISFHFGLPPQHVIDDLRSTGAVLLATATNRAEAETIRATGLDGIVAQGWQAGGHRGCFDPFAPDQRLTTLDLLAELRPIGLPLIAAGGIMSAADARAALDAGAALVQCGTAFLACPEASTTPAHRARLAQGDGETVMQKSISGRPARSLTNLFTELDADVTLAELPDYPLPYDAGKALNAAGLAAGQAGYGAFWAGTGAAQVQARPAAGIARDIGAAAAVSRG